MAKTRRDSLELFLGELAEGKLEIRSGEIWRRWNPRDGWFQPQRTEKLTSNGYLMLRARRDNVMHYCMAHRLIWAHKHGSPAADLEINHKNACKTDNRIENLELVTRQQNQTHAAEFGLLYPRSGITHPRAKLDATAVAEIRRLRAEGVSAAALAQKFGVRQNHIYRVACGSRRKECA